MPAFVVPGPPSTLDLRPAVEAAMFALILLIAALPADTWSLRTARMEGAAGNVREAAAALRETAAGIGSAGRLQDVAILHSQANRLNQRVVSASLASKMLDQPEPAGVGD